MSESFSHCFGCGVCVCVPFHVEHYIRYVDVAMFIARDAVVTVGDDVAVPDRQ